MLHRFTIYLRVNKQGHLLSNINQETSSVVLDKSQEELADYFGVARQSLLRLLKEFQSNGLIKFKRRNIDILDRDGLLIMLKNEPSL